MDVSSQFPLDSLISPRILAERIRKEIEELTGCTVSIGIGHNILLAKLATRKAKPNGSFHLNSSIKEHLKELNLEDLPGIGSNIAYLAQEHSIQKVGDLLAFRPSKLVEIFGKVNGPLFLNYANGIDTREIEILKERKSVGCDVNYGIRFQSNSQVQVSLTSFSLSVRLLMLNIDFCESNRRRGRKKIEIIIFDNSTSHSQDLYSTFYCSERSTQVSRSWIGG